MCGIVGAIGASDIIGKILEGLKRLEYRGYDSAGVSLLCDGVFETVKQEGKIEALRGAIKGSKLDFVNEKEGDLLAIGHTRWATHGRPSKENSHPHSSSKVCVVHNGIIENYQEIRQKLSQNGADFLSETDSEVIPHLLEDNLSLMHESMADKLLGDRIKASVMKTLDEIDGSYALAIMFREYPELLVIAKKGSPLLVGFGKGCNYIASDYYALSDHTNEVAYLNDDEFAFVYRDGADFFDKNGDLIKRDVKFIEDDTQSASKGDFEHFMLKEIYEQPRVISDTLQNYVEGGRINLPNFSFDLNGINKITIVACGTSYYAGLAAKYLFEDIARIEVEVDIASEFRYRKSVFRADNLMVFISQSGETADSIAALKHAKAHGQKILSIVNVANSSMAELSDAVLKTVAGVEIGVASTKAYTAQLMVLSLLVVEFAKRRGALGDESAILGNLANAVSGVEKVLQGQNVAKIQEVARYLMDFRHILYIGRGVSYVSAMEGALKFREISYIDAQAIAAGELKHGTIALIDEEMPIVVVAPSNELFEKIASNIEEVKARGGKVIVVSDRLGLDNLSELADFAIEIPNVFGPIEEAVVGIIPLQILAYYVSLFKGNDVDQPRNLAKSVTVE